MDQSFKVVKLDKREFACPSCMSQGTSLAYWAVGPHSGVMALLLRKPPQDLSGAVEFPSHVITAADRPIVIAEVSYKSIFKEEPPNPTPASSVVGRWAGDRVCMVHDDDLNQWVEPLKYTNITEQLVHGWNDYMRVRSCRARVRLLWL